LLLSGAGGTTAAGAAAAGTTAAGAAARDALLLRAGLGLLYVAAALTASSAVPYVRAAWPVLAAGKAKGPPAGSAAGKES